MTALGDHALAYARAGWPVFPVTPGGKAPAIAKRDGGRGVLDATTDVDQVARWWAEDPRRNIGGRVPAGVLVLDVDARSGGVDQLVDLEHEHGLLPVTLCSCSGSGGGSRHLFWRHPGGTVRQPGGGLELKTHSGYVVLPPSVHPSGAPYRWRDARAPILSPPAWLVDLLRPPAPPTPLAAPGRPSGRYEGDSVADWYSTTTTWTDLLHRHGWALVGGDGDSDGSTWRHPSATSPTSATVRHECLFVYSPNTPLPVTEASAPQGVTRFRAFALLEHGGDLSSAARAARAMRDGARLAVVA